MNMENKSYALVSTNEDNYIVSISTSKDVDKLVAKMKKEYESELSCLEEEGIEITSNNFLPKRKKAFINYGSDYSYFWEITETVNLD